MTRHQLVLLAREFGVFRQDTDGRILGAFHYPLRELAVALGMDVSVERDLDRSMLVTSLAAGELVLLSVDLGKAACGATGSHLVLLHTLVNDGAAFKLHDCAEVLGKPGANVVIEAGKLDAISNAKGLRLWPAKCRRPRSRKIPAQAALWDYIGTLILATGIEAAVALGIMGVDDDGDLVAQLPGRLRLAPSRQWETARNGTPRNPAVRQPCHSPLMDN